MVLALDLRKEEKKLWNEATKARYVSGISMNGGLVQRSLCETSKLKPVLIWLACVQCEQHKSFHVLMQINMLPLKVCVVLVQGSQSTIKESIPGNLDSQRPSVSTCSEFCIQKRLKPTGSYGPASQTFYSGVQISLELSHFKEIGQQILSEDGTDHKQ